MKRHTLSYTLTHGYVHNWLALGPCDTPIMDRPRDGEDERDFRARLLNSADRTQPDFRVPVEVGRQSCGENGLYWEVAHCEADHLLDYSGFVPGYTRRQAWAYVILNSKTAQSVTLRLATTCPVTLWVNDTFLGYAERLGTDDQALQSFSFPVDLKARDNTVLIRLEQVAIGQLALACALSVADAPEKSLKISVPTVSSAEIIPERQALDRAYQSPYLDRAIYTRDDSITLICPEDTPMAAETVMRMQTPDGWIFGETFGSIGPERTIPGIAAVSLRPGAMQAVLTPPHMQYYEAHLRARRALPLWIALHPYAAAADTTYEDRLVEALREAARSGDIYGELAHMAANWWDSVDPKTIRAAIERVTQRQAGCVSDLLALLSIRHRMAGHEKFPTDLLPDLDRCILDFDYLEGVGATDAVPSNADQLLWPTCRILAGQLFPKTRFTAHGLTGRQERAPGEESARDWLIAYAQTGVGPWNSHVDRIITALTHLIDLATSDTLSDLATVLLDKVLFGLALHSFRGVYAPTRGDVTPIQLRSGRFMAETAINRLLWGMGSYDGDLAAVISLALAGNSYELPAIIHAIASDLETEVWAQERHQVEGAPAGAAEVNTVTYRTGDFLLSSAQDYRPGQPGRREQVWQATLGPDALVFTNHPTSFSQSDSRDAGWWHGNGALPRVAQWQDALIALYDLPEGDWLGFTHAYFPCYAFDEHVIEGGWAFARVGDAYLAIYASQGLELMQRGPDAQRELRSVGARNAWLCQMGRRGVDSSFENFCRRVVATAPVIAGHQVVWETIRGDRLEFDWTGPLRLNDQEQPLTGFQRHASLYGVAEIPAETMDITYDQDVMRLNFA